MYRYHILLIIFCGTTTMTLAQQPVVDTALKFDKRFTQCEKNWVLIPKKATDSQYAYGYIYIDAQAGFTFDVKGFVSIGSDGKYIPDTSATKNSSYKVRIPPNWTNVALLPQQHFKEMNIQSEPAWVKNYYPAYTDTVMHNYKMGFVYNAANDCIIALKYLQQAYKVKPHLPGLEFEMAFAYNALNQPEQAINVLEAALKNDSRNVMFYRELGYAYLKKNDVPKAIGYYKQGIEECNDKQTEQKSEMAFNLAATYKNMGNQNEYKKWMSKAKEWSLPNSNIYKAVVAQGF